MLADVENWDPLEFYDKRIKELESLRDEAKSETAKGLFKKAIEQSSESLQTLLLLQRETIAYLNNEQANNKESLRKHKEVVDQIAANIASIKTNSALSKETKETMLSFNARAIDELSKSLERKATVNQLVFTIHPAAARTFQTVLLKDIFTPNNSTFNYDAVMDALKTIAGMLSPVLEMLNIAKENVFSASIRKKEYAKTGDKVFTYVEKYLDVLSQWDQLANQYVKVLQS